MGPSLLFSMFHAVACHVLSQLWWLEMSRSQVLLKCGVSLSSSSVSQVSSFKKFVSQKSKERQTSFNANFKKAKMDEFVTITIGIGSLSCGVFKPVRAKSLPLKVKKHVSAQAILDEALKKRSYYDLTFRNDKTYKLCFPDGSEVSTLPGTKEPFTLEKVFISY